MPRIYLDNAATSWPKPECVYQAVDCCARELGASAGRGAYRSAVEADRIVAEARRKAAALLGVLESRCVAFAPGATAALNQVIHGLLRPGDHVVTTVCEHNAVLRPIAAACRRLGVEVSFVDCDGSGYVDPQDVAEALRVNTRLAVVTHASNVTGAIQPVAEIAAAVRCRGVFLAVDAAQSAGHIPIDFPQLDADLLVASAHKGLLAPVGVGLLVVRPGLEREMTPLWQGGTGVDSRRELPSAEMPVRYESGTLNVPALCGLGAALDFLSAENFARLEAHRQRVTKLLWEGLQTIPGLRLVGPRPDQPRLAVISFAAAGYDPQEFAAALDSMVGVECRAGLHCAPRLHQALGTADEGGLVRFSPGWSTTPEEAAATLAAIAALMADAAR